MVVDEAIGLIFVALKKHNTVDKSSSFMNTNKNKPLRLVLQVSLMALTAIASCGETACSRIVSPVDGLNGIQTINKLVDQNLTKKDVCEEFLLFVEELLEDDDTRGKICGLDIYTPLFRPSEKIKANCLDHEKNKVKVQAEESRRAVEETLKTNVTTVSACFCDNKINKIYVSWFQVLRI